MLTLGSLVYIAIRPWDATLVFGVISSDINFQPSMAPLAKIAGPLPAFFHVCAFSMLSHQFVAKPTTMTALVATTFWTLINVIAEYGQLSCQIYPAIFMDVNRHVADYFCYGHFDHDDLAAALFGGVVSFVVLIIPRSKNEHHLAA